MSTNPRVTVVVPCYNHARYLGEAIASVIAQTYPAWEAIIIDDGSPDDTAAVAQTLIAAYPAASIQLIRQPNQGLARSRNTAIAQARGEYILPLDADDTIAPTMLAATVTALDADPRAGFAYVDALRFGAETTRLRAAPYDRDLLRVDCMLMASTLFRRAAWAQTEGFCPTMAYQGYEDWDFWISLAERGWTGVHIAKPLLHYRRMGGSMLGNAQRHDLELRAEVVLRHPALYDADWIHWARRVTRVAQGNGGGLPNAAARVAFLAYLNLVRRAWPPLLPKMLLRPLFWRVPIGVQGSLRSIGRALRVSR